MWFHLIFWKLRSYTRWELCLECDAKPIYVCKCLLVYFKGEVWWGFWLLLLKIVIKLAWYFPFNNWLNRKVSFYRFFWKLRFPKKVVFFALGDQNIVANFAANTFGGIFLRPPSHINLHLWTFSFADVYVVKSNHSRMRPSNFNETY